MLIIIMNTLMITMIIMVIIIIIMAIMIKTDLFLYPYHTNTILVLKTNISDNENHIQPTYQPHIFPMVKKIKKPISYSQYTTSETLTTCNNKNYEARKA